MDSFEDGKNAELERRLEERGWIRQDGTRREPGCCRLLWVPTLRGSSGVVGTRPYALRHTSAIINLARGENVKTVSALLGHADASYALDLYVGFIPAITRGLANRYVGKGLATGADDDEVANGLRDNFQ